MLEASLAGSLISRQAINSAIRATPPDIPDPTTRCICSLIDQYGHKSCAFIGFDIAQVQVAKTKIRAAVTSHERQHELQKLFVNGFYLNYVAKMLRN